ncbi:MAG: PTS sugar transporter subunit IIA, partial [Rhodothermaceae bacterium]|nr:PTS sugar transporter subunit IIA [Rhodothermaceae bacterium]
ITPNGEVNALAAQLGRTVFAIPDIHVLRETADVAAHSALLGHLNATTLFGGPVALGEWAYLAGQDRMQIHTTVLDASQRPSALFQRLRREGALPVAVRREGGVMPFHDGLNLLPGDRVVALQALTAAEPPHDQFDALVEHAPILDLDGPLGVADFVKQVARVLAPSVGLTPEAFMEQMLSREAESSTVILPGLAIPHLRMEGENVFALLIGRCREGIRFPGGEEPVVAAFTLVTSEDQRHVHLRALAAIAHLAQQPGFEARWLQAPDAEALRDLLLRTERRRGTLEVSSVT